LDQARREYESKTSLLRPELISGASSKVVTAAMQAQGLLDAVRAGRSGEPRTLRRSAGIRRSGETLVQPGGFPSDPGWSPSDFDFAAGRPGEEGPGGLMAQADWLAPHPRQRGRTPVPDVRGLFYDVYLEVVGKLSLRVTAVRLTEHPMPVDGLVVDQSPRPPARVRRASALTVEVWHPPAPATPRSPD
jgi:PASTA domain